MTVVASLAVIGNISVDYPVGPSGPLPSAVGGAALHVALAATAAGLTAAPIAVLGNDLHHLRTDPRLTGLDWSGAHLVDESSATFTLIYDEAGDLTDLRASYGPTLRLTDHALARIRSSRDAAFHVCCRAPLDVAEVLGELARRDGVFSLDFMVSSAATAIPAAARHLSRARLVFTNAAEHDTLAGFVDTDDLPAVVVTDGPHTARLYRHGRPTASVDPPPIVAGRVTGAGDTVAGAFLAAWTAGLPDTDALSLAIAAGSAHTTSPPITPLTTP